MRCKVRNLKKDKHKKRAGPGPRGERRCFYMGLTKK